MGFGNRFVNAADLAAGGLAVINPFRGGGGDLPLRITGRRQRRPGV